MLGKLHNSPDWKCNMCSKTCHVVYTTSGQLHLTLCNKKEKKKNNNNNKTVYNLTANKATK